MMVMVPLQKKLPTKRDTSLRKDAFISFFNTPAPYSQPWSIPAEEVWYRSRHAAPQIKAPLETSDCVSFFSLTQLVHLPVVHVANEHLGSDVRRSILSAMGLREGFPDYMILRPSQEKSTKGKLVFIEFKRSFGFHVAKEQADWCLWLRNEGYVSEFAFGLDHARLILRHLYGVL